MQRLISTDAVMDAITVLLHEAGSNEGWPYLVFCAADPDLTFETNGELITAKIRGKKTRIDSALIDRARGIPAVPLFDYK